MTHGHTSSTIKAHGITSRLPRCRWASYSLLSIVGVFHPLKMLPLVVFEIIYKLVWLIIVAYPLWSAGQLAASPAEGMTDASCGSSCRLSPCLGNMRSTNTF